MPGQMFSFPVPSLQGPGLAASQDGPERAFSLSGKIPTFLSFPGAGQGRAVCLAFFTGLSPEPLVFAADGVLLGTFLFLISLPSLLVPCPSFLFSPDLLPPPPALPPVSPALLLQRTCWRFKGYSAVSRPRSLTVAGDYKMPGQARGEGASPAERIPA